jgi:hypothetical protein
VSSLRFPIVFVNVFYIYTRRSRLLFRTGREKTCLRSPNIVEAFMDFEDELQFGASASPDRGVPGALPNVDEVGTVHQSNSSQCC